MILRRLQEYAETRLADQLAPTGYLKKMVTGFICLDIVGNFEGFISSEGVEMAVPHVSRSGQAIRPCLLADTGEYVLGIPSLEERKEKISGYHQAFKTEIQRCADKTQDQKVCAVASFLSALTSDTLNKIVPEDFDARGILTFRVDGKTIANVKEGYSHLEQYWLSRIDEIKGKNKKISGKPWMNCLVTGENLPVESRMPFMLKGIRGGNSSGTALVSANENAFSSYGLKNSLTSPISQGAADKFLKALNSLISSDQSRIYIRDSTYVFWTKQPIEENYLAYLDDPDPQSVANLLSSPFTAQRAFDIEQEGNVNQFYALALSANNARAVVRDWMETTVSAVQQRIKAWFEGQKIVDPYGQLGRPLSIYELADSIYRDSSKEMSSSLPTALIRSALQGDRLPEDLLVRLVRRNRVERAVTYPRAVLTKLIFTFDERREPMMTDMEQLNLNPNLEGNNKAAYYCGRLLAELESVQRTSLGSINASLTDRYYGAASSTPANAFPSLMRGARAHLSKLRKTSPGAYQRLEESLEEIQFHIEPPFPKTLNMQQQGIFSLGYYHQRAANRAAAKAASQAKA
jgi:CRISPR-associated protein Csd1